MQDTNLLHYIDGALRLCYGTHPQLGRSGRPSAGDLRSRYPGAESLRARSNVKNWLLTILRNIRLNQLRQRRAAPKFIELDADGYSYRDISRPICTLCWEDGARTCARSDSAAFLGVSQSILLREFEELTYQGIANLLGCTTGTVMSRSAGARSKLRAFVPVSDATLALI